MSNHELNPANQTEVVKESIKADNLVSSIVDDESGIDFMGGLVPAPLDLEQVEQPSKLTNIKSAAPSLEIFHAYNNISSIGANMQK